MNEEFDKEDATAAAISAIRACSNTLAIEADRLQQALPDLVMEEALRGRAFEWSDALRDTAQRVLFELALLQAESGEGRRAEPAAVIRRLSGLDAATMEVVAASTGLIEELEVAAERDEAQEPAFVFVIEMVTRLMTACESAQAATREIGQ